MGTGGVVCESGRPRRGVEVVVAEAERPTGPCEGGKVVGDEACERGVERGEADAEATEEADVLGAVDGVGDPERFSEGLDGWAVGEQLGDRVAG